MAELAINGGFEAGDLTGWSHEEYAGGSAVSTLTVQDAVKNSGTYAAKFLQTASGSDDAYATMAQTLDLTNVNSLDFYLNIPTYTAGEGETALKVFVDGNEEYTRTTTTSGFVLVQINVSGYAGEVEVQFRVRCNYLVE